MRYFRGTKLWPVAMTLAAGLVLVLAGVGAAQPDGSGPPTFEKKVFVHYAKGHGPAKPDHAGGGGGGDKCKVGTGGQK